MSSRIPWAIAIVSLAGTPVLAASETLLEDDLVIVPIETTDTIDDDATAEQPPVLFHEAAGRVRDLLGTDHVVAAYAADADALEIEAIVWDIEMQPELGPSYAGLEVNAASIVDDFFGDAPTAQPVPAPAAWALLGLLAARRRRTR